MPEERRYIPEHAKCEEVTIIEEQIRGLLEWRQEMRADFAELRADVLKIKLFEQQLAQLNESLNKLTISCERLYGRVLLLEKNEPAQERMQKWFDKGLWAAVGLIAMYVAKKVGLWQ